MEKLRKENEQLTGLREGERLKKIQEETNRHAETTEIKCIETREIEKIEERLHDKDGVKDEHTHIEVVEDHEGELVERVVTRCKQLDGLRQERGEGVCPLEAVYD